jgi:hypothetical protein
VDIQLEKIETRERKDREVCAETGAAQIGDDLLLNKEIEGWFESQPSELDKKQSEEDKNVRRKSRKVTKGPNPNLDLDLDLCSRPWLHMVLRINLRLRLVLCQ